ncbi:retrovirus-related Pol polyprotein from transposon TNT 1-94 [Trichonephila clavipes]|nr:retrovirus-related Pol polyprotein from transposon TNT 1-94 [Trichonephila clavipes]
MKDDRMYTDFRRQVYINMMLLLLPFGSTLYVGTPRPLRGKLGLKAKKGILAGFALGTRGYRQSNSGAVLVSPGLKFSDYKVVENGDDDKTVNNIPVSLPQDSDSETEDEETFKKMEKSPQQESWRRAMDEEFDNLKLRNVWKLTKLPPNTELLGCRSNEAYISYAANIFSQFQNDPGLEHWYGLLKLFGYVNKTKHYKLRLDCRCIDIVDFADADFAANRDDRISMVDNLFV